MLNLIYFHYGNIPEYFYDNFVLGVNSPIDEDDDVE
jgi:hypothetical protein